MIPGWDSRKPGDWPPENSVIPWQRRSSISSIPFSNTPRSRSAPRKPGRRIFPVHRMNHSQAIHGFYIAGGDHYHRLFHPIHWETRHDPEAGRRIDLEHARVRCARAPDFSGLSSPRRRGSRNTTFLDVHRARGVPIAACSTAIRQALGDRRCWRKLFTLPFEALVAIRADRLYSVSPSGAALRDVQWHYRYVGSRTTSLVSISDLRSRSKLFSAPSIRPQAPVPVEAAKAWS